MGLEAEPKRLLQGADLGAAAPCATGCFAPGIFPRLHPGHHYQHCFLQGLASTSLGDGLGGLFPLFLAFGAETQQGLVEHIPVPFLESLWRLPAVPGAGTPWVGCASGTSPALRGLVSPIDHTCTVTM